MWLTSWLPETKSRAAHRQVRRRRPGLRLEALEDRSLPSTFTVLNLADGGAGSLRQAVLNANASPGEDAVAFAAGLAGTIALRSGEMSITDDLSIAGPGAGHLTITGNNLSRAFRIQGSTTDVAVSGLTITNGRATGRTALGGGIFNDGGRLTLTAMTFTGNQAVGDDRPNAVAGGGAVASVNGAALTVTVCTFTGNGSVANDRSEGGAIVSDVGTTLTVGNSLFSNNHTLTFVGYGGGGAISTLGRSTATISATTFLGNRGLGGAGAPGRDGAIGYGGAVNNDTSLLVEGPGVLAGRLSIDHSTFTENEAIGGSGGPAVSGNSGSGGLGWGGAINNNWGGSVTITDTVFTRNRCIGGAGGNGSGSAHGGAGGNGVGGAIISISGHLVVRGSAFVENQATGGAGGSSEELGGSGGRGKGGAIHLPDFDGLHTGNEEPVAELEDVTFLRNQVLGGDGGAGGAGTGGNGGRAKGGALSLNDGGSRMSVLRGMLDGNVASGGQGGAGATLGRGGNAFGGGIANSEANNGGLGENPGDVLFVTDSIITNNRAVGGAGSVGGFGRGGGIDNASQATATILGTLIGDNQAVGGSGTVTGGNGIGGGLYNEKHSDVSLRGCTVAGNHAIGGSGATAGSGIGGGIYVVDGGTVWVDVLTLLFANDATTSDDDVFGILVSL